MQPLKFKKMDLKILCQNIANNPSDFDAEKLEQLFKEYAKQESISDYLLSDDYIEKWTSVEFPLELQRANELSWLIKIIE